MASLASYGACQTACNAGAVVCYASAGLTFGAVTGGAGAPAAAVACNGVLATCMAACATKFLAEGSAETAASGGIMGPVVAVGGAALAAGGAGAAWWMTRCSKASAKCHVQEEQLSKCMRSHEQSKCQLYFDELKACQAGS
eukprot:TRINITY_DN63831_c0_g1_i1.p1 TRINITY_DN63831_c0_g1~~TRINITY_DN63831_c0_g1_i1.p1  ORF type:complete len:154 (+),score=26.55 TRINITY_DN63831_c0_g1_i1:41-463(+)